MSNNKILSLDGISAKSEELQAKGLRVVLCHGTFDLMHAGHIKYLQRAKREGEALLVTVTADEFVNKGPGRPIFNERLRSENLAALECVDFVAINPGSTAVNAIKKIRPTLYVKGSEYRNHDDDLTGNISIEVDAVRSVGGDVFYTDEITFSSTSLLNQHFGVFSDETESFLNEFKERWSAQSILDMVASLRDMKVLVIGDAIIDEYAYVSPLGQTGKGNVLAVQYLSEEKFAGGAIAVANHIAQFVGNVTLVTGLGDDGSDDHFVRDKLDKNVELEVYRLSGAPTVRKKRFVDSDLSKLFEVYFYKDDPSLDRNPGEWLRRCMNGYDAVVVPDFGNGFVNREIVKTICGTTAFLSVNTQVNSGNRGYHVINRYARADLVSLNEPELRLAAHNRHDPLDHLAKAVARKLEASYLAVTRGTKGVLMYDRKNDEFMTIPALSTKVIDRIGAGDAFLSLASIALSKGLPWEVATFVGCVAAALDVQIVCNREPIDKVSLSKFITTLLK